MTRIRRGKDRHKTRRTRRVAFGIGRIAGPDLAHRLRAAGIAGDEASPADMPIEEFRTALARRIAMTINRWPGCPEPACKRARGCMAPRIHCSNARDKPMSERTQARAMARLRRQLKAKVEANAAEDAAAEKAAPSEKKPRAKSAPFVPAKAETQL